MVDSDTYLIAVDDRFRSSSFTDSSRCTRSEIIYIKIHAHPLFRLICPKFRIDPCFSRQAGMDAPHHLGVDLFWSNALVRNADYAAARPSQRKHRVSKLVKRGRWAIQVIVSCKVAEWMQNRSGHELVL
jgi:hypothetical protein